MLSQNVNKRDEIHQQMLVRRKTLKMSNNLQKIMIIILLLERHRVAVLVVAATEWRQQPHQHPLPHYHLFLIENHKISSKK